MTQTSLSSAFTYMLKRDLTLAFRRPGELINPILFFVIVVTLFPLGVGSEPSLLRELAPGVVWVAALLATLLALDGLFRSDFDDGSLEQMMLSPHPVSILVLAKVCAHWLVTGLPLIVISPLLATLVNLPSALFGKLVLALLLGTPTLSFIGAIGAALTLAVKRGGVLLTLLVLPLYVPVLIFGANLIQAAMMDLPTLGQFYLLGAMLVLAIALSPFAIAAALRVSLQ
ncbi:MAG: heme exporter protein CcmB [Gammaproteobacteria bacterium]|nr:heme exporter protein CcmB [Gammaproteobacteria bacterium]